MKIKAKKGYNIIINDINISLHHGAKPVYVDDETFNNSADVKRLQQFIEIVKDEDIEEQKEDNSNVTKIVQNSGNTFVIDTEQSQQKVTKGVVIADPNNEVKNAKTIKAATVEKKVEPAIEKKVETKTDTKTEIKAETEKKAEVKNEVKNETNVDVKAEIKNGKVDEIKDIKIETKELKKEATLEKDVKIEVDDTKIETELKESNKNIDTNEESKKKGRHKKDS